MQRSYWINFQQILHHSKFIICPTLPYCLFWLSGVAFSDYCQAEREQKPETGTQVQASLWAASLSPCFSGRPQNSPYLEENLHVAQVLECISYLLNRARGRPGEPFHALFPNLIQKVFHSKWKLTFCCFTRCHIKKAKLVSSVISYCCIILREIWDLRTSTARYSTTDARVGSAVAKPVNRENLHDQILSLLWKLSLCKARPCKQETPDLVNFFFPLKT